MTVFGNAKVDVEDRDDELLWYIFAPGATEPLIKIHYRWMFDISRIKGDKNAYNALIACLCFLGPPSGSAIAAVFDKFPNLVGKWIEPDLLRAMKSSAWATDKSRKMAIEFADNESKPKKKPAKVKPKRKLELVEDHDVIVDENGNDVDSNDGEELDEIEFNSDVVFETTTERIGQNKRKLNL